MGAWAAAILAVQILTVAPGGAAASAATAGLSLSRDQLPWIAASRALRSGTSDVQIVLAADVLPQSVAVPAKASTASIGYSEDSMHDAPRQPAGIQAESKQNRPQAAFADNDDVEALG